MTTSTGGRLGTEPAPTPPTATSDGAAALAERHVPLVAHLVREVSARVPPSVDRDDLRSAGLLALVTAARSFDSSLGVPFGSYAANRVRGALLDELRSIDWASRSVRRRSRDVEATRERLATAMGVFPDNAAVATALGITPAEVSRIDADVSRATVLPLHGLDESNGDVLPTKSLGPADLLERSERMEYLVDAIQELPDRLRLVVTAYFLQDRQMADIAAELGVTESRVSQLRAEALVLLRGALVPALEPDLAEPAPDRPGIAARRRASYADAVAARHATRRPRPLECSA